MYIIAHVLLPLNRGLVPFSKIFHMAEEAKLVGLIVRGWRHRRLVGDVYGRQVVLVLRGMRAVRVYDAVWVGNLKVPRWRGSGQKRARMTTR